MTPYRYFVRFFLPVVMLSASLFFACHPERAYIEDSDAKLNFTLDTVYFDTVFTTIGTVTKSFRIKNPHNQFVKIDQVMLAGGNASVFRINVDGMSGVAFRDLEIAPRDSMYVFVEATLNPNQSDGILRIQDSILFMTNGNLQDIDLVAWGQDVHILHESVIEEDTRWEADKPYLIIGFAYVDSTATLTIDPGVRVHLHRDALLYVEGTLLVNGTMDEKVQFMGDRLEEFYDEIPGQWGLIYLTENSRGNRIDYAEIINGTLGVLISAPPESGRQPDLEISNTLINRMSSNGIYALNAAVTATNVVIGDCGGSCAGLIYGGSYDFTHCTLDNNWPSGFSNRQLPSLLLTDYFGNYDEDGNLVLYTGGVFEKADFKNSVIYGSRMMELVIDSYEDQQLVYRFDHCLTRIDEDSLDYGSDPLFSSILNNENPMLDSLYMPDSLSPVIDAGLPGHAVLVPLDLNGNSRLDDEAPDLGAFEWQPSENGE